MQAILPLILKQWQALSIGQGLPAGLRMHCATSDLFHSQELPRPSEPINVDDSDDSSICDADTDTDSSVTIDNDPERRLESDDRTRAALTEQHEEIC
jgi:hypothetical protein